MSDTKEESREERQKKLTLQKQFSKRITVARQGREAFLEKDYVSCMRKYNEYLKILADTKEVDDIFKLNPSLFGDETQISELLLISHIYWEMARIYEMTPKFQANFQKSLNQFIKFTINQPFQVLNAEMLRKYIKINGKKSRHVKLYSESYSQILIESRKCYIATICFGDIHPTTDRLRIFKDELSNWPLGLELIALYYKYSTKFVLFLEKHFLIKKVSKAILGPILLSFSILTQTSIFKRCSYYLKLLQKSGSKL